MVRLGNITNTIHQKTQPTPYPTKHNQHHTPENTTNTIPQKTQPTPYTRKHNQHHTPENTTNTIPQKTKVCLLVGCLTSQQHASVSQGRICTDNFTCCHTEIEAADQTFHLTQSQYTDTGPTSPSADPITPGAWQGSHWSANV